MKVRSAVVYTVLRLLAFLVPLGIMMMFPVFQRMYWFAIGFAALIGLSLSIIFLRRPLDDVSMGLAARRDAKPHRTATESDADLEDSVDDALREHDEAPASASGQDPAPDDAPASTPDDEPASAPGSVDPPHTPTA